MKPITNILLIAAIICYVFLPFRTMDLAGSITGLSYSAGLITENFSLLKTIFALLPFIACFAGVAINSNKHRYWGVVTAAIIVTGIVFFSKPDLFFETWDLNHDPELIGDQAARMEGFKVKELNIGYYASNTLTTALSAVSTAAKRASQKCIKSCKRKSRTSNQKQNKPPNPQSPLRQPLPTKPLKTTPNTCPKAEYGYMPSEARTASKSE